MRSLTTSVFIFAVVTLFLLPTCSGQVVQNQLFAYTVIKQQPLSFLGFYDTLFKVNLTLHVNNPTNQNFPGGNITLRTNSPSGKWQWSAKYDLPMISAGGSFSFDTTFVPQEPGVYTVTLDTSVQSSINTSVPWFIEGGFAVLQIEPPSTIYEFFLLIVLLVGFVTIDASLLLRRRFVPGLPYPPQPAMDGSISRALNIFDAGQIMRSHLLEPKDSVKFEAGVCWLLEILGFHAIRLNQGAGGESVRVPGGRAQRGSADILAYDSALRRYLVISCTTAVPSPDKRQKIRVTADQIRAQMGNCDPILVSSFDAGPTILKEAEQEGLVLLDKPKLIAILELVRTERFVKAREFFD